MDASEGTLRDALARVWEALQDWDRDEPEHLSLPTSRAQLYRGAMEIPLVVFRPRRAVNPTEDRMAAFAPTLGRFALKLDCVEVGANYKINRSDSEEYVGRIQPDALRLHAERILALGRAAFDEIVVFYLDLPVA